MLDIPGYKLLGTLRTTGANVLIQAMRESDGLPVILKTPAVRSPGPLERERYRREFSILQRLRNVRGVVRAYSHEDVLGRPVITLERLQGKPLSELVGPPMEVPRFLELAISLASTLAELHRHGVIHKDIKPSNIVTEPEGGGARLLDFGVASLQRVEHLDAAPAHLIEGTLAYMSPEQTGRMNRLVDYRTDFYSLGVTFYELLTGSRPFQGSDALEWFHAHMAWRPKPPHELIPSIPPAVSALVMKLLAKTAEERYQSAEGLRADLEKCREGALEVFPLGARDVPQQFQLPQRLYGREAQVSTLLRGFERVLQGGQAELMLVHGYSGIGKSSLVMELHKPVVQQRGFLLSGKFDQFHLGVPYATLAQAFRGLVQQLLAGTDAELARWREHLQAAWGEQGQVLVELVPQLELVAGKQPPLQELPPTEAQNRFRQVLLKFLGVFATPEHPLVMFLDDLQWADQASLQLLQHLLTHPETPPLLLLGAYRDNEVSPSHPLMLTLEGVRKSGVRVTDLHLEPLSEEQVQQLVADALPGAEREVVVPLSALVHQKTGGNPFFLGQLLLTLDHDGLLTRTPEGGWQWNAEGVRAMGYSDNVVHFMLDKLRQLPAQAQRLLSLASCLGNVFSLPMLHTLSALGDVGEVEQGLGPALQEGLVMHGGPEQYRFLHDRIHQAAQALLTEEQRKAIHLSIGRSLLASLAPEALREKLFDVVSQLNAAVELMHEPAERHHLARLNAEAGMKARASVAHRPAVTYFTTAFSLIPGDPWETDAALAFKVRLEWATCEFMSGNSAEARRLVEDLLPRARAHTDMGAVYRLKTAILLGMGQVPEAKACALECLALLGMSIPLQPSEEEAVAAYEEVRTRLGERPIESLVDLPLMADPDIKVAMGVLDSLFAPAYFTDHRLLIIVLCRMVSLSLRYGFTDTSLSGFCWLGVMAGSAFKRYREGLAWGQLARELLERHNVSSQRGKVLYSLQFISFWSQPLSAAQEIALRGFHHAMQMGDIPAACYCGVSITANRLVMGHHLDDVYQESVVRGDFARRAGSVDARDILLVHQRYVQQLRGHSLSFDTLSGEGFDEKAFEASLTSTRMGVLRCVYWITRLKSRFMCGAYKEAVDAADRLAGILWVMRGSINLLDYHTYRALALAANCEGQEAEAREKSLEAIREHHLQLAQWAESVPETFRALERMVFAELARLEGRLDEAIRGYEAAIRSAQENGFTQNVGIAAELAANFWRARQAPTVAQAFASEAHAAYRQWGALGKARVLEARWPGLSAPPPASADETTSTESMRIDALTVVKAQQAISGEIVLERLVTTLLQVAIANAGAQRGALLLPSGDTLSVAAISGASPDSAVIPSGEDALPELPWALISYVKRTHEHVLIGDASQPHKFPSDPYLRRGRARSVLCLPLMRQEVFSGALYLENELATNAFSEERISLLSHLASQAAISIENARLYADIKEGKAALRQANEELEQRVEERTRELKEAQARLVDTAREVGMTEVASNVLHNVGNVLTSAVINVEMMRRHVGASRVGRVKQAAALLLEHREDLADFLTQDSRGNQLPDYLAELSDELIREQERLMGDVEAMSRHIEHIRAIVQVQQNYAKTSLLAVECDLGQLVDDALRIQLASLKRHGISVTRELSELPKVQVDKHKVLQILINLISNAKHALDVLPESQRALCVRLTSEGKRARIQVVDNGMGIAPENRERLFSHGFTTRKDGHGFGLHASVLAAQQMGGNLTLESEGPGKGATATLELPLP
ncbi:ATP-binding sensor histidine kinase [Vitiosangium sp. GDMCC 1.1324]|uniref:trifunctional serine/threonine-protein kinase/ATP-binding protein/sensor histidine kinase n=1 Tax=Vitiosangium sp. (strain GDMCC 1.1324) TaxID=2138576 RepID=UPI000D3AA530|nr:ATP-binding sensor histidine kinase [Vitiosangium sp. GDMCC 1.1324]PTL83494.1 histidine kinase [Vitiosangium sp. GDMCC 1.1324]